MNISAFCCSSHISKVHSWRFVLGEGEGETSLERPRPEAEHLAAARYSVQHAVWGKMSRVTKKPTWTRSSFFWTFSVGNNNRLTLIQILTDTALVGAPFLAHLFTTSRFLPKFKTLLSTCSETASAKPWLSVGEVQRETAEQVWVVSSQDRHMLSQARPAGTHLKSFSPYLQKHKDTKSTLSHGETEPVSQRAH